MDIIFVFIFFKYCNNYFHFAIEKDMHVVLQSIK